MKKWKSICKILITIEIVVFMLPLSFTYMMGIEAHLLPFIAHAWDANDIIHSIMACIVCITSVGWWFLAICGLISLWKLFLNYDSYTSKNIPRGVRAGLVMGLLSLLLWEGSMVSGIAIGYPLLYWVWSPLLLVAQMMVIFKYRVIVPQVTWQEKLQLALLTDSSIEQKY